MQGRKKTKNYSWDLYSIVKTIAKGDREKDIIYSCFATL